MAGKLKTLFEAVEINSLSAVKTVLSSEKIDFDINERNGDGFTVLHVACHISRVNSGIVKLLLQNNANINALHFGNTPLHFAVKYVEDTASIDTLLQHGAYLHYKNDSGVSPFEACFEKQDVLVTRGKENRALDLRNLVLSYQTDVNFKDDNGKTALHYAVQYANFEIVEKMIQLGFNVKEEDDEGMTPLHYASMKHHDSLFDILQKVRLLISAGADINARDVRNDTVLSREANFSDIYHYENGHSDLMVYLLELGADTNMHGYFAPPLYHAVYFTDVNLTKMLIQYGADVHVRSAINGWSLLKASMSMEVANRSTRDKVNIAKMLLLSGSTLGESDRKDDDMCCYIYRCLVLMQNEVCCLKVTKVCKNVSLTYYDMLVISNEAMARYLRRKDVRDALESIDGEKTFEWFYMDIENKHKHCQKLMEMSNDFLDLLEEVFGSVLPREVLLIISEYFNEEDLKVCFGLPTERFSRKSWLEKQLLEYNQ